MSVDLSMRYHVLWKGTRQDGWQKGQGYERSQAGEADDGWMGGVSAVQGLATLALARALPFSHQGDGCGPIAQGTRSRQCR